MQRKKLTYAAAGVNISEGDAAKKRMAKDLATKHPLVLNTVGAFASLCDGAFPGFKHPVLVCKTEEPGSKQLLAISNGRYESIAKDMIHHLINDVAVMGATPLFVQDLIVCGKLEKKVVNALVRHIAAACKAQGCVLTGGETSEQPNMLAAGSYVLGSSCIGIVEKHKIIDGQRIQEGDIVLALESSGLHTNGFTLVRSLLAADPFLARRKIRGRSFLDLILEPHRCYFQAIKGLFAHPGLHGMAHITGGGIPGNLNRILPEGLCARIDASSIEILPLFTFLRNASQNDDDDMTRTFNLGVGMTIVVDPADIASCRKHLQRFGVHAYPIGEVHRGKSRTVHMEGALRWE